MTTHDVFFLLAGLVTTGAALRSVLTQSAVEALLWAGVALGALGGCYLVLGAEFVALTQVLVYVVAIAVLVLVAARLPQPTSPTNARGSMVRTVTAALIGAGSGGLVAATLISSLAQRVEVRPAPTAQVGTQLFGTWVWPLQCVALLLVVASVAAVALVRLAARAADESENPEQPERRGGVAEDAQVQR